LDGQQLGVSAVHPPDPEMDNGYAAMARDASGRMYLAGQQGSSVLGTDGSELRRFSGQAADQAHPVPWDAPASVAVDNRTSSLMVVNHALFTGQADPRRFVVFDVVVDDRAFPLEQLMIP
jgi:hypothetical protein